MSKAKKLVLALIVLLGSLEVASRFLFGNYAQSALVERTEDPNLCMVLKKNQRLDYTGWYRKVSSTVMQSDEYGSRGFVNGHDNQDLMDIFMLGDSFTYGQGVNIEFALPTLVDQQMGKQYRVWNFGVPGRNFYQMPADVKRLANLQPDLIVVNLFVNDFHEPPGQCMLSKTTDWVLPIMRACHICRWGVLGLSSAPTHLEESTIEENVVNTIQQLERQSQELSIPILFVLMMDHHVHRDFTPRLPPIHTLVHTHASHWIDLQEVWATLLIQESQYQIAGEYHWNEQGNQILATSYAKALTTRIPTVQPK